MQLPRVQYTLRRMMVAVALVAAIFWFGRMYQRWSYCRRQSAYHQQLRAVFEDFRRSGINMRGYIILSPGVSPSTRSSTKLNQEVEEYVRSVADSINYHNRMELDYCRAARLFWLPIPRDVRGKRKL